MTQRNVGGGMRGGGVTSTVTRSALTPPRCAFLGPEAETWTRLPRVWSRPDRSDVRPGTPQHRVLVFPEPEDHHQEEAEADPQPGPGADAALWDRSREDEVRGQWPDGVGWPGPGTCLLMLHINETCKDQSSVNGIRLLKTNKQTNKTKCA